MRRSCALWRSRGEREGYVWRMMLMMETECKRGPGGRRGAAMAAEEHRREALDFVLELAGSRPIPNKMLGCDSLVQADELPVPMFVVDLDMCCILWNKRATELSGWAESEVSSMRRFTTSLFSSQSSHQKEFEDFVRGALEGQDSTQQFWNLKTKWGHTMKVLLYACARTDAMGGVSGVICVIMPLDAPGMLQPACKLERSLQATDKVVGLLDPEENNLNDEGVSPQKQQQRSDVPDLFLAAFEHPPSPCSDGGVDRIDIYGDPGNMVAEMEEMEEMEETSVCSQDWCKSEQESHSLGGAGSGAGGLEASGCLSRARALVLDPEPWGRKSLKLMLERCGFEVVCACGNKEALWHLQQSLQHPEGFSVIFINLSVARMDNYAIVRNLRLMEQSGLDNSSCSMTPALFVAVTDLDRLDFPNMRDSTQKDVAAGVDAVINYPSRVQQLRDTLTTLGVSIDHLDFGNKSAWATFNSWNNPLILAR